MQLFILNWNKFQNIKILKPDLKRKKYRQKYQNKIPLLKLEQMTNTRNLITYYAIATKDVMTSTKLISISIDLLKTKQKKLKSKYSMYIVNVSHDF